MKSKTTAGVLAILLGGLGAHKFYLGRTLWGILYLLFCWTFIPAIVALIEGITYFTMSDGAFNAKYNGGANLNPNIVINNVVTSSNNQGRSMEERLRELQRMLDTGLINKQEYEAKRREIMRD
ncbi:MAG: NINE protein [Bacteroidia bacterium]|nr:NINE protein [Bacteroidia bacterium]